MKMAVQQLLTLAQHLLLIHRLSLLEEWRGIRDEPLSSLSGIQGCIFVHASGFIGGNETRNGALSMARKTLQHRNTKNTANGSSGSTS